MAKLIETNIKKTYKFDMWKFKKLLNIDNKEDVCGLDFTKGTKGSISGVQIITMQITEEKIQEE